jgi:hypothetical protein
MPVACFAESLTLNHFPDRFVTKLKNRQRATRASIKQISISRIFLATKGLKDFKEFPSVLFVLSCG